MKLLRNPYDIFISYRRENGFETAGLIAERLRNAGYRVFFDVESLKSGKFNEQLYQVIDSCQDFVLVLPEKALDRSVHADDWVRLEIERALSRGKNIIPVMLRGFEWPKPMPKGLEELSNFQAVASGSFEYFDASIQRLRGYLKSKPGVTWRRHRRHLVAAVAAGLLIAGGIAGWRWKSQVEFERTCRVQSSSMGLEIAKVNQALTVASQAKEDWDKYWKVFPALHPQDTAFARKQFVELMDHRLSNLAPLVPAAPPGDATLADLARRGIRTDDVKALYSGTVANSVAQTRDFIGKLRTYAGLPFPSPTVQKQIEVDFRVLGLGAKLDYVGYLELVASMPKAAKDETFYKLRRELDRFRDVSTELSVQEYEAQGEDILRDIENAALELGKELHSASMDVERMQHDLDLSRQRMESGTNPPSSTEDSIGATVKRIQGQQSKLDAKIAELGDKNKELEEAYARLLKKCAFANEDDQWMQWGKIQRLLTNLRNTVKIRAQARTETERNRAEAKRKGLPASSVPDVGGGVPLDRMVADIEDRLDKFVALNRKADPASAVYAKSAKRFASLLSQGKVPDAGILVMGTENDAPHPTIRTGDIVVSRKGRAVRFVSDFSAQKTTSGPDVVEVLRWDASSGKRSKLSLNLPAGSPRIGFLELRDGDE